MALEQSLKRCLGSSLPSLMQTTSGAESPIACRNAVRRPTAGCRRVLDSLVADDELATQASEGWVRTAVKGTRFVREWGGEEHVVIVHGAPASSITVTLSNP